MVPAVEGFPFLLDFLLGVKSLMGGMTSVFHGRDPGGTGESPALEPCKVGFAPALFPSDLQCLAWGLAFRTC